MSALQTKDQQQPPDSWGSASIVYANKAEHVTRPPAEELITWINRLFLSKAMDLRLVRSGED